MNHLQLIFSPTLDGVLEFSHFDFDADAGIWKKENIITRDCIKINVFVQGRFSVFSDGVIHCPVRGDVCLLPPMKMHYGQIKEAMHVNYYQIDIGREVFSRIPDGKRLFEALIKATLEKDSFIRPSETESEHIISMCEAIESSILQDERYLAYAKIIELIARLKILYGSATGSMGV